MAADMDRAQIFDLVGRVGVAADAQEVSPMGKEKPCKLPLSARCRRRLQWIQERNEIMASSTAAAAA